MRNVRERIAVALTFGGLIAGGMQGCVSDDSAAPSSPDGGSPQPQDSGSSPVIDATTPHVDGAPPLVDGGTPPQEEASAIDAAPPPALVRFAWFVSGPPSGQVAEVTRKVPLAADAGAPGYDVCVAPHGTGAWVGPLLAKSSFTGGLAPFDVTKYFAVEPGRYDARIVAPGSTTCDLPDAGAPITPDAGDDAGEAGADEAGTVDAGSPPQTDFTGLPPIASGSAITVVLVDPQDPTASVADVHVFSDDTMTSAGKAKLRFVNVSNNDTLTQNLDDAGADAGFTTSGADFGLGGGTLLDTKFVNVTSQAHLDPGAANGYREIDPVSGIDATMLPQTGVQNYSGPLATDGLALAQGTLFSAFYATESNGAGGRNPVLVWCYDGASSTSNALLSKCAHTDATSDSALSYTRFGNFLADNSDRDVCVKYHSYGTYFGPLLKSNGKDGTGIPAQSISAYFNLHGGFAFDARFVNAGAASCAIPAAPDTTYTAFTEPNGGGYTTLALTGYGTVPDDAGTIPPYDAGPPYSDDAGGDAGPQPTSSGLTTLGASVVVLEDEAYATDAVPGVRLVHLAANHPQPMTLSVNDGIAVVGPGPGPVQGQFLPLVGNTWELDNVPYGGFSTRPGPTDPFGYEPMASGTLNLMLETNVWTYTMNGDQTTMFAYDAQPGVALLACDDYQEDMVPGSFLYQDCCVVGDMSCGGQPTLVTGAARPFEHAPRRHLVRTLPLPSPR